jgi:hypothetical protein
VRLAGKNSLFIGDFNLPEIDLERGVARGRAAALLEAAGKIDGTTGKLSDLS